MALFRRRRQPSALFVDAEVVYVDEGATVRTRRGTATFHDGLGWHLKPEDQVVTADTDEAVALAEQWMREQYGRR